MIARIWRGKTRVKDYDAYTEFLKKRAIQDYKGRNGFIRLIFLRKIDGDIAYFTLITFWRASMR